MNKIFLQKKAQILRWICIYGKLIDFFLYPCNNHDPSIVKYLDPNLVGTLPAQACVRTWGAILTHFSSFWRGRSTWLLGQFAQLGFMTFLYLAEVFPRRWRNLISVFWGNSCRTMRNQWPCSGQQPPLTPFGNGRSLLWMNWAAGFCVVAKSESRQESESPFWPYQQDY